MDKNSKVMNDEELEKVSGGFSDDDIVGRSRMGTITYVLTCPENNNNTWSVSWPEHGRPSMAWCPYCRKNHNTASLKPKEQMLGFF
jgi:bacteriocin-like protein